MEGFLPPLHFHNLEESSLAGGNGGFMLFYFVILSVPVLVSSSLPSFPDALVHRLPVKCFLNSHVHRYSTARPLISAPLSSVMPSLPSLYLVCPVYLGP